MTRHTILAVITFRSASMSVFSSCTEGDTDLGAVIDNARTQYEQTWHQVGLRGVIRWGQP